MSDENPKKPKYIPPNQITEGVKKAFIAALREIGIVRAAAEVCQFSAPAFRKHKMKDQEFSDEWDHALQDAIEKMEAECYRRAMLGIEKPVFYQGKMVGAINERSDRLMEFMLAGLMPEKYGKNRTEITGKDGKALIPDQINDIELARRIAFALTQATKKPVVIPIETIPPEEKHEGEIVH